jgi:hypothetical protein
MTYLHSTPRGRLFRLERHDNPFRTIDENGREFFAYGVRSEGGTRLCTTYAFNDAEAIVGAAHLADNYLAARGL